MSIRGFSRGYDVVARYDGTLFASLLPHTSLENALGYGSKIIDDIAATTFSDPNFPTKAGISVGVVTCQNGSAQGADRIFGEAMRSLLLAKGTSGPRISGRDLSQSK